MMYVNLPDLKKMQQDVQGLSGHSARIPQTCRKRFESG